MGKNTSDVWSGAITDNVFNNTYEFSLSEKIGVLYPTSNNGINRDKIDESFANWSVGNPAYSTYQRYTGDSINNITKEDTKITHKIGLVKYDTYSKYTVQPFNSISDYVSYSGNTSYQISGNDIRVVNNFDYSDIYVYPTINLRILNKETGGTENVNNLTIAQFKQKIDNAESGKDYYIHSIGYRIQSRKTPNVGLPYQYCIMSIIDIDDIQFICGGGRNGLFNYNEFRYYANQGGIVINNNGSTKIPTQCYNIKEDLTYTIIDTLNYNSYLKADYKIVMEYVATLGFWFYDGEKFYLPEMKNNQTTGKYFPEEVLDYIESENKDWGNSADIDNKQPSLSDEDELEDSGITLNGNGNSFIRWFAVTGSNLLSLIDSFDSETVPAGFVPLDHIVGVYQVPFNIPDFSNCGSLANIFVGKYDTNVQGMPLLNQGSYSTTGIIASKYIEPTHNNFLDYEPYTSLSIYLPFCGSCNLDANLFVGKTVNVNYFFDIFSGDVIANVYANKTLYKTLSGNFTISQPITSQNVGLQKDTVIKGAVGVATNMLGTAGFAMSGNISGALSGAVGATISSISTYTHLNGISPVATKGGGGRSIFYTCKDIILYKSTAIENHGEYKKYRGKVCNYDSKLSECHGYTVVDNPHIEIKCTNTEKDEIKKLLEDGVILP